MTIEYRVREVTRYIVTRWEGERQEPISVTTMDGRPYDEIRHIPAKSMQHGEFDNAELAYGIAYALCKTEHDKLGYPPGDDRIQYPELPKGATGDGMRF